MSQLLCAPVLHAVRKCLQRLFGSASSSPLGSAPYSPLFASRHPDLVPTIGSKNILVSTIGSKNIIDDTLLWSTNPTTGPLLFRCVCAIFLKYRVSFHPKKCDFLKDRVEWIGHDLRPDGNSPAQSKFDLLTDWTQPQHALSLNSFIGLVTYYNCFVPWFEPKIKPLRTLEKAHHRLPIPDRAWTPDLSALFVEFKTAITSDPCLARYDDSKPCFLKTDWSANGMGFILMQPADTEACVKALAILEAGGPNTFDELMSGARLRPVRFGSRRCTERERHFHSFVGEGACGRWAIGQLRKYLWGALFYWLCDCSAVKEILDYDGDIHQIRRWAQELLGYHFAIIHRSARMMRDVASLSCLSDELILRFDAHSALLRSADLCARPAAYSSATFTSHNPFKCPDVLLPSQ
jgi:hypothetical protein